MFARSFRWFATSGPAIAARCGGQRCGDHERRTAPASYRQGVEFREQVVGRRCRAAEVVEGGAEIFLVRMVHFRGRRRVVEFDPQGGGERAEAWARTVPGEQPRVSAISLSVCPP